MTDPIMARKITVIIEQVNGNTITMESDLFDYIDFERRDHDRPWDFESYRRTREPVKFDLVIEVMNVGRHTLVWREKQPELDDPTVVESDGDGR